MHDEHTADAEIFPVVALQDSCRQVPRMDGENPEKDAQGRVEGERADASRLG